MKFILDMHDKIRPLFEKGGKFEKLWPLFDAQDTFMFTPGDVTHTGAHVRDAIDLKRVMITVVMALVPCTLFGIWNAGYHYNITNVGATQGLVSDLSRGALIVLPIIFVSYAVGGLWEVLFSCVRRHEINEGFLVTGLLFPLTLPPTIPLWQVAVGISFGVVLGKEVFGGTGMNVLNPALTSRAFIYFAYPAQMSGNVWTALVKGGSTVDGFTGATPLAVVASLPEGTSATTALHDAGFSFMSMANGIMPGSIGETCAWACLFGAIVLILTKIGSWQIMTACVIGLLGGGWLANLIGADNTMSQLPPLYHLVIGSFAFGAVFMATDPVSAAATPTGKWIYGILIGLLIIIVRVANPAYAEGVMLAILFMNVMAPLIDHYVVAAHIRRRTARG
ncbi:MAG: NADH:ubiquinone reductase (Na(+)-transporting) subunit B [Verrucomicrobia bacterium]|nr:NADH:ubiquinone reductase (Na(+)-transporting) subunit B [Verrucomicrobiota bacterium]